MTKSNWNDRSDKETLKVLKRAFFEDFKRVKKKHIRLMLKSEHKALSRKNSIIPKKAVFFMQRYLKTNQLSVSIFNFRSLLLKYTLLPNYTRERNKLVVFYTNYAKKHCKYNQDLYQNLLIGILSGIDAYRPNKKYSLGAVIMRYAKKHANFDFDVDFRYPYRIKATDFHKIKHCKIPVYTSVSYDTEYMGYDE